MSAGFTSQKIHLWRPRIKQQLHFYFRSGPEGFKITPESSCSSPDTVDSIYPTPATAVRISSPLISPPLCRQCPSPALSPPTLHEMTSKASSSSLSLLLLLVTLSAAYFAEAQRQCTSSTNAPTPEVRAGYWFHHSDRYSPVSSINASLYTHIYYYSLGLDESTWAVATPDPDQLSTLSSFSATLRSNSSSVKTLLSVATDDGRGSEVSVAAFSSMAADPTLRAAFISSAIDLARANAFDGLDLAWRYPAAPADVVNLASLLAEWRARIEEEAQNSSSSPLLLTATVYFSNHLFGGPTADLYYPVAAMSSNLDWVNALCFGYHKSSNVTVADAALYNRASHFSTSYGVTSWLDAGMPACKLVMGIPLYGRSWFLKNKAKNTLGAPVVAEGRKQKLSNQTGLMAYFEIEELLKDPSSSYVVYDNWTVSSYFHSGDLWVSFDGPEVIEEKIEFAVRDRLLGYFLWPISFEDSTQAVSRQGT